MAVVVTSSWSAAYPSSKSSLITKVTRMYGVEDDNELRAVACEFLDDTIKDMNSHLYEFNKQVESGITLVADDDTYVLNTQFYRESMAYVINSAGAKNAPMLYMPYVRFIGDQKNRWTGTGVPYAYTLRNVNGDGTVTLAPTPSAGTASEYTLTVEYYRRIPLVTEEDPLNVPQEVETALIYGAQKRMAVHIKGAGHPDVTALHNLETDALKRLKAVDKRHPDQQQRFRVVDFINPSRKIDRAAIYIKVN